MKKITLVTVFFFASSAEGYFATNEWLVCSSSQGIAVIAPHERCEKVAEEYFTKAQIDLDDYYHIKALMIATKVLQSLGEGDDLKELPEYLGEEWLRKISINKSSEISGVIPDHSNTLGSETYKITFNNDSVVLFVEANTGEHEWVRIIE